MRGARCALVIAALISTTAVPGAGGAAFAIVGSGGFTNLELRFPGASLLVEVGGIGGPIIETYNDPMIGETGRGAYDFAYSRDDGFSCGGEGPDAFTIEADPLFLTTTFTSVVPGCSGTVTFDATAAPGVQATLLPDVRPSVASGQLTVGIIRSAPASGSIAGDTIPPPSEQWVSFVSRSFTAEAGAGP